MNKEKAIKKEKEYAERRFGQLLAEIEHAMLIHPPNQVENLIKFNDQRWRAFCEHLIYLSPEGKDEFMKVARQRAFKTIIINK